MAADALFRVFTACPTDPRTLILDVRPHKQFDRAPGHVAGAYCIRLSANGAALLGARRCRATALRVLCRTHAADGPC